MIRSLFWEIKMDLLSTSRYRFGVISDTFVYGVLMIFFVISETGQTYEEVYNYAGYTELTIIGYIAWIYASTATVSATQIIGDELRHGTFYKKCNSKYPVQWLLLGRVIAALFIQSVVVLGLLIGMYLATNIKITINIVCAMAMFISSMGMYGIGLMISGLTLFYKKIGAILYLTQLILLFVTDTIPTSNALVRIMEIIPLTLCNKITRLSVTGGLRVIWFGWLLLESSIWIFVGYLVFGYYMKKAKMKGNILFF